MANNKIKKKGVTKKKKSANISSNKKNNRLKKIKQLKPCPNDSIALSKQLQIKKTSRNNKRTEKKTVRKNKERVCPNGKRMPSLAEMDKLFEDSETDSEKDNNTPKKTIRQSSTPQINMPTVLIHDIFAPSSRNKISKQVKLLKLSDCHDDDVSQPPPKKRLKFDTCDSSSPATSTPNNNKIANFQVESLISIDNQPDLLSIHKPVGSSPDHNQDEPKMIIDTDIPNENSSDSNKTLEYTFDCQFSPRPSTSKDNNIMEENHELFIKSLEYHSANKTKSQHSKDEKQFFSIPICQENEKHGVSTSILPDSLTNSTNETNVPANICNEDDDVIINEPNIVQIVIDSEPKINDCDNNIAANATAEACPYDEDDDCIIIESDPIVPIPTKPQPKEDDIIDLEYELIEECTTTNNNNTSHIDDEVIDVDALIAQNQSIISKFNNSGKNNLDNSNLVVDVVVSTLCNSTKEKPSVVTTQNGALVDDYLLVVGEGMRPNVVAPIILPNKVTPHRLPTLVHDNNRNNSSTNIIDISNMKLPINNMYTDSECTPESSSPNLGDCPVCMELLTGRVLASTICGHLFCMSCIELAVKTNKRCPTCRKILKNNGYHQIFL